MLLDLELQKAGGIDSEIKGVTAKLGDQLGVYSSLSRKTPKRYICQSTCDKQDSQDEIGEEMAQDDGSKEDKCDCYGRAY